MEPDELIEIRTKYGHICLHRYYDNPEQVILTSLYVRKNRRNGNGTHLIKQAEQIARSIGAKQIWLQAKPNSWQEQWYKRLGYEFSDNIEDDTLRWLERTQEEKTTSKTIN